MTAFTTPRTWAAGTLAASDLNTDVRDNINNLNERLNVSGITTPSALNKIKSAVCGVRAYASGSQSIGDSADKTVLWDSEVFDSDGFHSTASNTHRITIPSGLDGTYLFTTQIAFAADSGGWRSVWMEDSGGTIRASVVQIAASGSQRHEAQVTMVYTIAAGDWIAVHCTQTSGSTLTLDVFSRIHFGAVRLFAS
jgi:hypothetical protein